MEYWRPIERFDGVYWVSDQGHIGKKNVAGEIRPMSPTREPHRGYMTQRINWKGKRLALSVHREIALAWLPNPERLPLVRHLDDVKDNNLLSNLAWGGARENANDSVRNGTNKTAAMTHCASGRHERTPENLVERTKPDGRTTLTCKPCELERVRRSYARNAEKRREYARQRVANMTPEERQALNAYHSAWNSARRQQGHGGAPTGTPQLARSPRDTAMARVRTVTPVVERPGTRPSPRRAV